MPDPDRAEDLAEFVGLLGRLRAWAGMPSYRTLAKRVGPLMRPARTVSPFTVVDAFTTERRRLDLDLVVAIVRGLGADDPAVDLWRVACIRVSRRRPQSVEEVLVVAGARDEWLARCARGLITAGFKNVRTNEVIGQITADFSKFPTSGELTVTAIPDGSPGHTRLTLRSTAAVDNLYALFASPNKKILSAAKAGLG